MMDLVPTVDIGDTTATSLEALNRACEDHGFFLISGHGLDDLIVTRAEFLLTPGDPVRLQERLLEIMKYKKNSQPMRDRSAGCAFTARHPCTWHASPRSRALVTGSMSNNVRMRGLRWWIF